MRASRPHQQMAALASGDGSFLTFLLSHSQIVMIIILCGIIRNSRTTNNKNYLSSRPTFPLRDETGVFWVEISGLQVGIVCLSLAGLGRGFYRRRAKNATNIIQDQASCSVQGNFHETWTVVFKFMGMLQERRERRLFIHVHWPKLPCLFCMTSSADRSWLGQIAFFWIKFKFLCVFLGWDDNVWFCLANGKLKWSYW